jgi:hypothetical protein
MFCNSRVAVIYFSPRPLCRFDLAVRAISIRRRIAYCLHPTLVKALQYTVAVRKRVH